MSDFFIPKTNNNDDYWNKVKQEAQTKPAQAQIQTESKNDYWQKIAEPIKEQKQQHYENWNRYGIDVPDEYYEVFNKMIPKDGTEEEAQEEAYKIGSAYKYMQMMGCDFYEAYDKVDAWNEAQFDYVQGQKARYEALSDMWTMGTNQVKLGELGQKLMRAHASNDTELTAKLMEEINAINEQNNLLQDNTPRKWLMQALEAGAQSAPFTGVAAGAGLVGNFISPGAGMAGGFVASSYLSAGWEYIDMIANGATPQTARVVSAVSGGIQGYIEVNLGLTNGLIAGLGKGIAKGAAETTVRASVEEIGRSLMKRFNFGPAKKILVNYLAQYGKNVLGEGVEEFLQEITSQLGQDVAACIDGYDIPYDNAKEIVSQATEAFKGGILGALALGFIPAIGKTSATIKDYRALKQSVETNESPESFYEENKNNRVFEGLSEENKKSLAREIWERAQQRKEEEAELTARDIAEGRDAAEGAEETLEAEEGEEAQAESVARDENGRLYTSDDGNTFLVGDATKNGDEGNRYGYIRYNTDENGNIVIDTFKMTEGREGLRNEVFDEFAREHPDVNIEWNAVGNEAQTMRQSLIDNNPSGAKNGLRYYSGQDISDIETRRKVASEVRRNIHNVTKNADGTFTRTELTNDQVASTIAILEMGAKRMNMTLSDYVQKTFGNQIFGSREEFETSALAQGENINNKAGGMSQGVAQNNWREVGQRVKAVIYAGENADFSTWVHEVAHVFQNQLDGDLKTQAETAFNVVNGDWINSNYTFKDGRTMSSAEAFAYGFQDWLETGQAETEQQKTLFQKFAQFLAEAYNRLKQHLNFTPEIENVFNQLLATDDSIMSKALKAAQEEDNAYRARLQQQAEEKENARQAQEEEQRQQEELEKEEASETTEFAEEEQSAEEIESELEESNNEEETGNAIDDALENLNLSDEQKTQTAEVLKDETTTIAEKANAIVDAAGSEYVFKTLGEYLNFRNSLKNEYMNNYTELARQYKGEELNQKAEVLRNEFEAKINEINAAISDLQRRREEQNNANDEQFDLFQNEGGVLYQIAGELGAQNLDNSEEVREGASRMEELGVAKQMEKEGKTAEEIRHATAWEKGDDGLWRYEIPDGEVVIPTQGQEVNSEGKFVPRKQKEGYLKEFYKSDELFRAYPDLNYVYVRFVPLDVEGRAYYAGGDKIDININYLNENSNELKKTLTHEIQHIIQRYEGFAKGASPSQFTETELDRNINEQNDLKKELIKISNEVLGNSFYPLMASQEQKVLEDPVYGASYSFYKDQLADLEQEAQRIKDSGITSQYDKYHRAAGEVESRNVETRINMTPEQRRNFLLAASEDVAPEDKIILFQATGEENAELLYQLAGEPSIRRMAQSEEKTRILDDLNAANELEKKYTNMNPESRASRIRWATGWERDANGQWKYELDDSVNMIKNGAKLEKVLRSSPDTIAQASEEAMLNLGDIYNAPELYKVFPYMKNVRVSFYSDPNAFRAVLTPEGIKVNVRYLQGVNGETGLKGVLAHEIQHVIQAMEYAESKGLQGTDIEQLYNDMMKAMQAAGEKKYDYDLTSLQQGLDAYMQDAGEIEARNVARRILMNADERRYNTLASTEDVKRDSKLLYQIAGEIGAQNLDDAETQEGVSRMQNLAIAKQMEADGKDAKAIRLATGWEKGTDGLWRWEIDDSQIKADFEFKSVNFRKEHPRYDELAAKLEALNYDWEKLSKEEQEEFDKLGDMFNEGYYKNEATLSDVIDDPELFKAYPQLKKLPVMFHERRFSENYEARLRHGKIYDPDMGLNGEDYYDIEFNGLPNSYNSENFLTTLLHEIQHAIQRIEGFGKGGTPELAADFIEKDNQRKAEIKEKAFAWEWKIELEKQEEKHPELKGNLALLISLIDEYTENGKYSIKELEEEGWLPSRDSRDKGFNLYVRGYDKAGYEDAFKEWQETASKKGLKYFDATKDTEWSRFSYYKRFAGEVESRNVEKRQHFTPEQRLNTLIAATEDVAPEDKIILFQTAYHGSGASFDKFDTENYGLTGEGSMSFGYGTYLTDSEEIARDYAERQRKQIDKYADNPYERDTLEREMFKELRSYDFDKSKYKDYLENQIKESESDTIDNPYIDRKAREKLAKLDAINSTNLYTVEIPDNGYLQWDNTVPKETRRKIVDGLYNKLIQEDYKGAEKELKQELSPIVETPLNGKEVYDNIWTYLGSDKEASQFLHTIGFAGIKYLAGQNYGNGNGAYNYVIFNDDDAKIIDHLLFQTNAELMTEAQGFESWQEFMDFCEVMHSDDEVSPIPSEADAQWYQNFWETAHGLQTEQEKNEQAVQDKNAKEDATAPALDALFSTYIRQNPEMLDDFLHEVARIDAIDLESDEWRNAADETDAKERERIDQLKDAIAITMSDYNWQSAMRRIQGGGEISEGMRKRLMGEMTDTMKSRDFRALYAEVMEDAQYAVDEADTTSAMLTKKLQKYQKRYYDIVKPGEDISKMSPEKRKRIAEQMANRDIANKIRNGSLKLDDELDAYIKSLDAQIKEKQKQFDELEKETKADYQRIADAERRRLLKLHDELLIAKAKVNQKNSDTARKINKGLKITEKYKRESQNLQANYDELFRKFNDLKNSIQLTAEVQAALDRQEQVANVREDLNAKQKEKNLTAEAKKMRIQLVKRTMRRVPFNRIDYNNAKTLIAIQRMLEPNLIGGVNRFIGIDSPFLRGVISQVVTDSDYKEKLMNYLAKNSRASEAFVNFKNKLQNLKSIKDFDSWTAKERKAAIKYLPKENWVRDLNLKELAKEREESIDLDIDTEEYSRPVYDENGKPKTYKDADGIEHNVTETAFRLRYSDELGQLVKDAVGADMFDRIVNRPFSEWTTEELEQLAQRIDELYTEGRDLLAAKNEARKREAEAIRRRVEDAIKDTGIVINDDDTPEEKERKQKEINKILNLNSGLKGTEAGKEKGIKAKMDRLIHGYSDMNVLRFGRMLDNQTDGENVYMLYRREDECYNNKTRSINNRARAINEIMKANNITEGDLAKSIAVPSLNTEFTVDELLYFLAADKDYAEDEVKLAKGLFGLDANDDWAATSRNAVMFGNMMSDTASQEQKEAWVELDKQMKEAIENDTLTPEQKQLKALGQLDEHPGTSAYISYCHDRWAKALEAANTFIVENPKYTALMEAIEADYAAQYERMNEISINEFNMPVHRVRAYVPLVRRESNGDTNVNQVKEDLLATYGADAGKQWVNKGMTQRRVNMSPLNQKPVQTGLFATWGSSVERTEHFIAYAPYVRQLNAVYKSRDASYTRRFIESRYGKGAVKYLDDYINEVANPSAGKMREAGAEWLHTFRGRTAPAYLGWKFSAIIKQGLTSPWPYMQFVNPAEYAAAALECTKKGTYDAIKEKSVFMHNRVMDPMNELVEEMAEEGKSKFDRALGKFGKTGMKGLEWIDWVCVAPGWLACYKKEYARLQRASEARYEAKMEELRERNMYADIGTSQYLSPEQMEAQARQEIMEDIEVESVRYADDCTRQCQPSSRAADLAPLFKNSSEAMKAFLQFQTSLNVIWQNIRYDMPYAVRNKQFNRIVGAVLGYVFAGVFMNSVMDGVKGDDDDDEAQALRNLIFYSTTQFTDAIPLIGSEVTNTMDQVITGKRGFMNSGTDMTPSATKMLSVFTNAAKGNWKKAAELTAEGIGLYMGAPVSGLKEINKLLGKPLENGEVDIKRGVGDVYGALGDILEE